jgi:hypothetical protein
LGSSPNSHDASPATPKGVGVVVLAVGWAARRGSHSGVRERGGNGPRQEERQVQRQGTRDARSASARRRAPSRSKSPVGIGMRLATKLINILILDLKAHVECSKITLGYMNIL